ncbi:MAG: hypothetical protein COA79_11520 [Planctomycetota bacterium]|nr:MAG: hypothetical protein COA79_11520 [Planctomycetota bacterium]
MRNFLIILIFCSLQNLWADESTKGTALFKKVDPSVVAIQIERSGGSGFIITEDGYILTNGHVISDGTKESPLRYSKKITVILNDETKYQAKVIGHCMDPDIALLKIIPNKKLIPVTLANSSKVQTGQKCYALGMPVGHKRTLTSGIISNKERVINTFTTVLQTDAAINPGNSGGPLFNDAGEVIGINTYKGGGQLLGFTIPINVAITLKEHFLKFGYFKRAIIPFFFTQNIYEELSKTLGVPHGVLVVHVESNSKAFKAGLRTADIIMKKNGDDVKVKTIADLLKFEWEMTTQEIGSELNLLIKRNKNNKLIEINIKAIMEEDQPAISSGKQLGEINEMTYNELGIGVLPVVTLSKYMYYIKNSGVIVSKSQTNTPASYAGIFQSYLPDLISKINDIPINSVNEFEVEMNKGLIKKSKFIKLEIIRGKIKFNTVIKPNYKLINKKIGLIILNQSPKFYKIIHRTLISLGADIFVYSKDGSQIEIKSKKRGDFDYIIDAHKKISELEKNSLDAMIILDDDKLINMNTPIILKDKINKMGENSKTICAIGNATIFIINAGDSFLKIKVTSSEVISNQLIKLKSNFTGKNVESDENIITCTGIDESNILSFLAKIKLNLDN